MLFFVTFCKGAKSCEVLTLFSFVLLQKYGRHLCEIVIKNCTLFSPLNTTQHNAPHFSYTLLQTLKYLVINKKKAKNVLYAKVLQ